MSSDKYDRLDQISNLIAIKRFDEAMRICETELSYQPDDTDFLYHKARCLILKDNWAEAEIITQSVLNQSPESAPFLLLQFSIFKQNKQFREAEEILLSLLKNYPEDADLYAEYAILLIQNFHLDKARKLIQEGFRLDPENSEIMIANCLLSMTEGKTPEHSLSKLISEHPDHQNTCILLGNHLIEEGKYSQAFSIFQSLFLVNPDDTETKDILIRLKVKKSPFSWILYPLNRFKNIGIIFFWAFFIGATYGLKKLGYTTASGIISMIWIVYCIYSWIVPSALRFWYQKRGF
ncbi:tetratricopeptide repeat protein [Leptospira idonii]|nr:tetratricopeptide repeat protein [Leptospira idonii]